MDLLLILHGFNYRCETRSYVKSLANEHDLRNVAKRKVVTSRQWFETKGEGAGIILA